MAQNTGFTVNTYAWVVELVDTLDLGSSAERCRGSSPLPGTMLRSASYAWRGHMRSDTDRSMPCEA
jgi:hypothetical protein